MTERELHPWEPEELAAALGACERTGRLEGLELEYWVGGGQPMPYRRSDQFRCLTVDGRELIELARPKFLHGYDPTPIEKFQLAADPDKVKTVARLLREGRVFEATYAEERDPHIADILSFEVLATRDGQQAKKTYYKSVPDPVRPLHELVESLCQLLVTRGERGLYHLGKRIE